MRGRATTPQLQLAFSLPLWGRLARQRLRWAFSRWKRRSRIESTCAEWAALVVSQQRFLLRKLVVRAHWQRVSLAFNQWSRVVRECIRVARRMVAWHHAQLTRLAWATWRQVVLAERLDEEAAACRCVMWTRKADRLVARTSARHDSGRLVDSWLAWKTWSRRERCKAWRHGLSMAARKCFVVWQRYSSAMNAHRALARQVPREVVETIIDDCLAQCLWRENVRNCQRSDSILLIQTLFLRRSTQIQWQWLKHAFDQWLLLLQESPDQVAIGEFESPRSAKLPTFPERFSAAYREKRRTAPAKPASGYRRSWR